MAVIVPGSIVSDIRGSVGDETYARNQGGLYVRARTTPADPNTGNQQACRAAMTALSQFWSANLTEQQRHDWRTYARQHPRRDRFGNEHLSNGYTRFIRINFHRYRLEVAVAFPDAPTHPPIHPPLFTFTALAEDKTVTIVVPPDAYDPPSADLELFAYGGDDVNPGVAYYNTPWRYIARNEFNGVWDHDPWTINYPLVLVADHKVYVKLIAQNADTGELSTPYQTSAIIKA